uniref:G patch domain-containing protein 11 n=1 Tax=Plectus sambesii TaxID=2011161 RepID=A0A914VKL4_9BILA
MSSDEEESFVGFSQSTASTSTAKPDDDEEEEEDYMSDTFMTKLDDVRPGVASGLRSQQREIRLNLEREAAEERTKKAVKLSRGELEKERREEALKIPIAQDTKGFELMAKMGYKPGMSLGKKREGQVDDAIKEPIAMDLKMNRTGLGHDKEEKRKCVERVEAHYTYMAKRAKISNLLIDDFKERKRNATLQKQQVGEVVKCRKVCQELDSRQGVQLPAEPWFWPSYRAKDAAEDDEDAKYFYANGVEALPNENLYELDESALSQRVEEISAYLRQTYSYCIWCGQLFENADEMADNCPGDSKADHDGEDNDL